MDILTSYTIGIFVLTAILVIIGIAGMLIAVATLYATLRR